jgi:peptide/nickel transport system substrate-binding protein
MKKFLMLLLIVILATACAPTTSTSTTSLPTSISPTLQPAPTLQPTPTERESTLIVAFSRDPTTLDPAVYYEFEGQMVIDAVYEQLVTYMEDENGKLTIVPKLAERWDVSSDYKEYTFYLRKGVKFHDGEPYNAEAQKLAYERMASINAGPAFMISAYVDTMEVVDEYTLKISLNGSYPEYLDILAGFWCPSRAVSPKAVTDHTVDGDFAADWFRENAVGTGPYKLESWTHGQQIVLVKNEDYWGGWAGSHFNKVIVKIVAEASTQRLLLEKGDIDAIIFPLTTEDAAALRNVSGITVGGSPTNFMILMYLNTQVSPTKELKVRQALVAAFDYETALNEIFKDTAVANSSPIPIGYAGYVEVKPKQDLEKAKQLLAEAGYPPEKLSLEIEFEEGNQTYRRVAEMFQSDLRTIGVDLSIREITVGAAWDYLGGGPESGLQIFFDRYVPDNADALEIMAALWHTKYGVINFTFLNDPEIDSLLDQAMATADPAKRTPLLTQINQKLLDDAVAIIIGQQVQLLAWQNSVGGVQVSNLMLWGFPAYEAYRQ